ncbi:MAG: hypothetical protein R3E58_16975 [Phycisphaerae bacterium]|nr:hypothetical protein [Phycisphaerales bacterium]
MLALAAFLLVTCVYVVTLANLPKEGFWIVDNGCKFVQMESIIRSDYTDYAIDWPGSAIDPEYKYSPLIPRFGHVIDGKLYGTFAPFFPLISTIPYRLWGMTGLYVIPLLGGLLTLAAVWKLASILIGERREFRIAPALAIVLVGLGTPVWFYSVEFWEHTPGTGLACWAFVFFFLYMRDSRVVWAALTGLACAASIYFRDDLYVLTAVLAVGMALVDPKKWHRAVVFGVVAAIALVPLWWFQWKVLGNPLGHHFTPTEADGVAQNGFFQDRWLVLRHLFFDVGSSGLWSLLFTVPIFVLWLRRMVSADSSKFGASSIAILAYFGLVGGAAVLYFQAIAPSPPIWLLTSNSLFAACPLLVLAFAKSGGVAGEGDRWIRVSLCVLLVYALLYALLSPEIHAKGVHWGCRYLLTLYPLLAVFAAHHVVAWWCGADRRFALDRIAVVLVFALSIGAQVYALRLMSTMKDFRVRLNAAVTQESEDTIIANSWWIPMELYNCFGSKTIYLDRESQDHAALCRRLYRSGVRKVTLLHSPPRPDAIEKGHTVLHDQLGMFAVELETVRLP